LLHRILPHCTIATGRVTLPRRSIPEREARSGEEESRAMDPIMTAAVTVAVVLVSFVIFVLVFRWIWNHTVPAVFGLKEITFWQAVGILILASILTGGHRVVSTDITNIINAPKRTGAALGTAPLPG
jgi:succinate dehydrogenase hydrophobic anchor subunit